jgi:hypothetical protein
MNKVPFAAIALVLLMPAESFGHRVDEYLQASRVLLGADRITLEVDVTPGAEIASVVTPLLDPNRDDSISPAEAEAYGRSVLADIVVELDGSPVAMTLAHVEAPTLGEIRDGLGTIRIRSVGTPGTVAPGRRLLQLRNGHQPVPSVYQVNALVPEHRSIDVVAQTRDPRQQSVRIEYAVASRWPAQLTWLIFATAGFSLLVTVRRAHTPRSLQNQAGPAQCAG